MGEREVDAIIAQWRASARAAGESESDWSAEKEPGRWRHLKRGRVLVLLGVLVAVSVAVVLLTGQDSAVAPDSGLQPIAAPSAAGSPTPVPEPLLDDWFAVMADVDRVRGEAYSSADGSGLAAAFLPAGPAMQQELDLLKRMRDQGVTAPGWGTRLVGVSPVRVDDAQATLRVTDERAAYDLVGADGTLTPVGASPPTTWLVTLRPAGGSWLVEEVEQEAATSATSPPAQP